MMNFVFENLKDYTNFVNCSDINPSAIKRFSRSPLAQSVIHALSLYQTHQWQSNITTTEHFSKSNLDHYIIASGVNHHPNDWTGSVLARNNNRINSFYYLNPGYLKDLQQGRAMLLFDQSLEGYQTPWLWQYFHDECEKYCIPPQAIVYVTGNVIAEEQYSKWCDAHDIASRINVIPYIVFEYDVTAIAREVSLVSDWESNYDYKRNNVAAIKTFNCLQKRLRAHRIWFYKYLVDANLTDAGLISMNHFASWQSYFEGKSLSNEQAVYYNKDLPKLINGKNNNEQPDHYYIRRITDDVFLNSWVSVISEASAGDGDGTIFISEKIFKPIICFHPFIVVGNKNYLEKLREMGYKTFEGFIDESYDKLPTFEKYHAIVNSIQKIDAIDDKLAWFKSLESILLHNYDTLRKNTAVANSAQAKLYECYTNYFKLEN